MQPVLSTARRYLTHVLYPEALASKSIPTDWRGIFQRLRILPLSADLPKTSLRGRFSTLSSTEWDRLVNYNLNNIEAIAQKAKKL